MPVFVGLAQGGRLCAVREGAAAREDDGVRQAAEKAGMGIEDGGPLRENVRAAMGELWRRHRAEQDQAQAIAGLASPNLTQNA